LLAEILNFQGANPILGMGSLSTLFILSDNFLHVNISSHFIAILYVFKTTLSFLQFTKPH